MADEEDRIQQQLETSLRYQIRNLADSGKQVMGVLKPLDELMRARRNELVKELCQVREDRHEARRWEHERIGALESEREFWHRMASKTKSILSKTTADSKRHMLEKHALKIEFERFKEKVEMHEKAVSFARQRELHEEKTAANADCVDPAPERISINSHLLHDQRIREHLSTVINAASVAAAMYQRNLLTLRELETIQSKSSCPVAAAESLLGIVAEQPTEVYECFLESLKMSNQQHVNDWLVTERYKDYSPCVWHTELIRQHYVYLLESMDSKFSGLVSELFASDVLDVREREEIEAQPTLTHQNERLMAVLSRKSSEQFGRFLEALDRTGQGHVRNVISGGTQTECATSESKEIAASEQPTDVELMDHIRLGLDRERNLREKIDEITRNALESECEIQQQLAEEVERGCRLREQFKQSVILQGSLKHELEEIKRILSRETAEKNETKRMLHAAKDRIFQLEKQLTVARKREEQLNGQLQTALEDDKQMRHRMEEAAASCHQNKHEQRLNEAQEKIAHLRMKVDELQETVRTSESENVRLSEDLERCRSSMNGMKSELERCPAELEEQLKRAVSTEAVLMQQLQQARDREAEMANEIARGSESRQMLANQLRCAKHVFLANSPMKIRDSKLLDLLGVYGVLDEEQRRRIKEIKKLKPQRNKLLTELLHKHDDDFKRFLVALDNSDQHKIADDIRRMFYSCIADDGPLLLCKLTADCRQVCSMAVLDNRIFVICYMSDTVKVFGSNNEPLKDIVIEDMCAPRDIVACPETGSLYIADLPLSGHPGCIWRLSAGGKVDEFLTDKGPHFKPRALSVTSPQSVTSRRLLVTSHDELRLFGAIDGVEVRLLSIRGKNLKHAVETSAGTFIVCQTKPKPMVNEIDYDGHVIRSYDDDQHPLMCPRYLAACCDGKLLVADWDTNRVWLLTNRLELERILIDERLVNGPRSLLYAERSGQLCVVGKPVAPVAPSCVNVFDIRGASGRLLTRQCQT